MSWNLNSSDVAKLSASHLKSSSHDFYNVSTSVVVSRVMCEMGVNHLMLGVEPEDGVAECITYNNFYPHPITCAGMGKF